MVRTTLLIVLAILTIVLSISGLIICAFGVIDDLDHLVLIQTSSCLALITTLYALCRVDGTSQTVHQDRKEAHGHA